jgi:PAS domain S-box-containing protein
MPPESSRTPQASPPHPTSRLALGSDAHYHALVAQVRDYAIIMLDLDGYVTTWNTGAELIKGYRPEEIIGQHFSCFYPPEEVARGKTTRELQQAAATGRFEDEDWRVRKDGTRFWANVVITALRDPEGQLIGFGKLTRDLTERKQIEELVARQAQEILEVSTPVVQVWPGVVVAPLIGLLDDRRAEQLMGLLLHAVEKTRAAVALVDITGVPMIDTQTAQHLITMVTAVRLLGAQVVLTGIRPALAQTLVHLGIDLSHMVTRPSLAGGLHVAFDLLGLEVIRKNGRR